MNPTRASSAEQRKGEGFLPLLIGGSILGQVGGIWIGAALMGAVLSASIDIGVIAWGSTLTLLFFGPSFFVGYFLVTLPACWLLLAKGWNQSVLTSMGIGIAIGLSVGFLVPLVVELESDVSIGWWAHGAAYGSGIGGTFAFLTRKWGLRKEQEGC